MTFVSIIARENFLNVASDGRVLDKNRNIVDERYKKFLLPTPQCFVAYAGQKEPCELFLQASVLRYLDITDYKVLSAKIQSILLNPPFSSFKILIAFGGLNLKSEIEFCTFSTLEPNIQHFKPMGLDISYAFLNNSSLTDNQAEGILIDLLKKTGFETSNQIRKAQIALNDIVADRDFGVNKDVFCSAILAPTNRD